MAGSASPVTLHVGIDGTLFDFETQRRFKILEKFIRRPRSHPNRVNPRFQKHPRNRIVHPVETGIPVGNLGQVIRIEGMDHIDHIARHRHRELKSPESGCHPIQNRNGDTFANVKRAGLHTVLIAQFQADD